MSFRDAHARRPEKARQRKSRVRRERVAAFGSLLVVAAIIVALVLDSTSGSKSHPSKATASAKRSSSSGSRASQPVTATVPILAYHVINVPPSGSSANPDLYVSAAAFSSQMAALKANGWHAVTLDQVEAYWTRGASLGPGKPIVITFDNGYASQYTNAVPVLKQLGWVGVENLQVNGLPPADGGLTDSQIRGLISAGWELDTQGMSHADLITVNTSQLSYELTTAKQTLHSQYGVPVNWFSYPFGHYNATVIAAVRAAGYVGATTIVSGWASAQQNRFSLPRLQVLGTTSPAQLLSQIASAKATTTVPASFSGPGNA